MSGDLSSYYDKAHVTGAVERGDHRNVIGGLWDELGNLQIEFLKANGLKPDNTLLDIGCGSLRLGVHAVAYLNPGRYWGTDLNPLLFEAGYVREIVPAGLADKLPRQNLVADEEFTFEGVTRQVDFAIATSVFTHLPLNHLRLCLANLAQHVETRCTFYFTVFTPVGPINEPSAQPKGGIVTYGHRDPYHYLPADVEYAARGTPWTIEFIGDWDHPRNQMIVKAEKG